MHILLVSQSRIPVFTYGGTERVIWDLGYELSRLGHRISYLVSSDSYCPFAEVLFINPSLDLRQQIPKNVDIVHFQFNPEFDLDHYFEKPYVITEHGNTNKVGFLPLNSIFVSQNHAQRHGSEQFVHNGLNWDSYGPVNFDQPRKQHHFLGKAAWRVKNVRGAIDVALKAGVKLNVLGGTRLNLKRGFRYTWSRKIKFHGMVGGTQKFELLNSSNGMIFPVRWHEPFGLAVIESLYFGCPVFGTPYGALPELITDNYGFLSSSIEELVEKINTRIFDHRACHKYAIDKFSARNMANSYIEKYEKILCGEILNLHKPTHSKKMDLLPWN